MRVVVIGGDAAGATAASQVRRICGAAVSVTMIEEQTWTSYSACGIPYWIAGDTDGPTELVARSPEKHRANGIDVHTATRAVALDLAANTVTVEPVGGGPRDVLPFDHLVLATGSRPFTPAIPGLGVAGVHRVQTLDQGSAAVASLRRKPHRAVVVGGGYIGVEMAEAAVRHDLETTLLHLGPEPMGSLDSDMGQLIRVAMEERGVVVRTQTPAQAITQDAEGRVDSVITADGDIPADIVFLGLGVVPRVDLIDGLGLPQGASGGILTDSHQRVQGCSNVWAAGDCTEVLDRQTHAHRYIPLGTHANKQGRVLGLNLAGRHAEFAGVVGTAITKFCELEIARVGLRTGEGEDFGMELKGACITASTQAGYMPGATPMTVKMIGEAGSRLLRGVQIVGGPGAGKRIDTAATAIWAGLTVDEVIDLDLAYAPPFSPVWDPVQTAARKLQSLLD